ncbi:C40 family peptidase [Streptomyces neyagawaensis]|uniref:C40 family peptidase n=1 Tax=Streptomyces neyagawaensis TaxID=42238 RepID=UPI0006E34D93|nr:C40 family peptidase [Streptomyces neyagawaensis]MCL6737210.1 C40 family peptidase [Streptomyces neyagawaensis]MDE1687959.1 C40 family peptidase [Streptomyces neyagawaensis]
MSGKVLRLVRTATATAVAAGTLLTTAPVQAAAAPLAPPPGDTAGPASDSDIAAPPADSDTAGASVDGDTAAGDARSVAGLLTDLRRLFQEAEEATEAYNATEEELRKQRAEVARLDRRLSAARLSLHDSRGAAGRLARQQYQNSTTDLSPYVRLLLARDPHRALEQGHVIGQVAQERAQTVERMTGSERTTDALARRARAALDRRLTLTERRQKERDAVRSRLGEVERLLASLTTEQLAGIERLDRDTTAEAQRRLVASGALSSVRPPTRTGAKALRYAVAQIGKPYKWGAEGPKAYDCSGLTSRAWSHAGRRIPRTSQAQWARLPRIPLTKLRPGDLVLYYPKATHVALYLGKGLVVQAPRPGTTIKVSPIAANPLLGAVRPDPKAKPLKRFALPKLPRTAKKGSDTGSNVS